jgi:chromosomal replication initiation ATPase DnaA
VRTSWWDKATEKEGDVFIREIIAEVADEFKVFPSDIIAHKKKPKYVSARHKAMWRARTETDASYLKLARIFKRDHTTVIHGVRCWEAKQDGKVYKRNSAGGSDRSATGS